VIAPTHSGKSSTTNFLRISCTIRELNLDDDGPNKTEGHDATRLFPATTDSPKGEDTMDDRELLERVFAAEMEFTHVDEAAVAVPLWRDSCRGNVKKVLLEQSVEGG